MLEKLAKLTAKTCSLTPLGGKPELTWEDVASSLPHLVRHGKLFIFAKFCMHKDVELLQLSKEEARKKFKNDVDVVQINTLASIALDDALGSGNCKKCQGAGQIKHRKGFSQCSSCGGTGRTKELSGRKLARDLGVSPKKVKYFWRTKLNELLADYQEYEYEAEKSLKKGLRRDDDTV